MTTPNGDAGAIYDGAIYDGAIGGGEVRRPLDETRADASDDARADASDDTRADASDDARADTSDDVDYDSDDSYCYGGSDSEILQGYYRDTNPVGAFHTTAGVYGRGYCDGGSHCSCWWP